MGGGGQGCSGFRVRVEIQGELSTGEDVLHTKITKNDDCKTHTKIHISMKSCMHAHTHHGSGGTHSCRTRRSSLRNSSLHMQMTSTVVLDKDTPLEGVSKRSRIKDVREWDAELLITTTVPAAVWGCVLVRPAAVWGCVLLRPTLQDLQLPVPGASTLHTAFPEP